MATPNIDKILDNLEAQLNKLKANKNHLEYWEDHGDGGYWRALTDYKAEKILEHYNGNFALSDFQVGAEYFLIAAPDGIKIVSETELAVLPSYKVLYQGSKEACKNFIKVD